MNVQFPTLEKNSPLLECWNEDGVVTLESGLDWGMSIVRDFRGGSIDEKRVRVNKLHLSDTHHHLGYASARRHTTASHIHGHGAGDVSCHFTSNWLERQNTVQMQCSGTVLLRAFHLRFKQECTQITTNGDIRFKKPTVPFSVYSHDSSGVSNCVLSCSSWQTSRHPEPDSPSVSATISVRKSRHDVLVDYYKKGLFSVTLTTPQGWRLI